MKDPIPAAILEGRAKRVHLIAICGVAMAALAGMLKQRGYEVSGSDENVYPPMSEVLARLGIPIRSGFRAENLADRPDLVVVGNKVSRNNPEVEALLASGIPYASMPEVIEELFLRDRLSVVIAGTHGKTTSTAMMAVVLDHAGRRPSVLVGGDSVDFGGNYKLGDGEHFVIEGDEYDTAFFDKGPKFLHYRPGAVILTAVEFDHADIYRDLDHVKSAFRKLIDLLPAASPLLVSSDFPHAVEVASSHGFTTFGLAGKADWSVDALRDEGERTRFTVLHRGRPEGEIDMWPPGPINARNALGVFAMGRALGLSGAEIAEGLREFRGVARRQEKVAEIGGVTVIDDFAHHPTAVAGTLSALRLRYPRNRLWAVFEPRSNTSRRKVFQREYLAALAAADQVVIGGVFQKQTDSIAEQDLFSPDKLAADLTAAGSAARAIGEPMEIAQTLGEESAAGDVIILMSNGSFGGLRAKLVAALEARFA